MDDTQIEMLPMLGEFSSIASQYEHIMFYYESGDPQSEASGTDSSGQGRTLGKN